MQCDAREIRCEQVLASWAIFGGLLLVVVLVERFGVIETAVGVLGGVQWALFWRPVMAKLQPRTNRRSA